MIGKIFETKRVLKEWLLFGEEKSARGTLSMDQYDRVLVLSMNKYNGFQRVIFLHLKTGSISFLSEERWLKTFQEVE